MGSTWHLFLVGHKCTQSLAQMYLEDTQHTGYHQLLPSTVYAPFHFEGHFSAERRSHANIFVLGTCLKPHPSPQGELSLASNFLSLLHNLSPLRGSYPPYTHGSSYSQEEMAWKELLTPASYIPSLLPHRTSLHSYVKGHGCFLMNYPCVD